MKTYYSNVIHYLKYYVSTEHKLYPHYIFWYITCLSLSCWFTHMHHLLLTLHQYEVCKHETAWIRLIAKFSKIQLLCLHYMLWYITSIIHVVIHTKIHQLFLECFCKIL